MDVRCEKCATEYELDDAKVTEAGVTVKCTSCGNLFKVRKRAESRPQPAAGGTNKGVAAPSRMRAPTVNPPTAATGQGGTTAVAGGWMLRGPDGTITRFRELTTLQQWIVERKVSRDHEISRSGDAWKRLGDITELSTFFQVVEQADAAARAAAEQAHAKRTPTRPFAPPAQPPATPHAATVPVNSITEPLESEDLMQVQAAVATQQAAVVPPPRPRSATQQPPPRPVPPVSSPPPIPREAPPPMPQMLGDEGPSAGGARPMTNAGVEPSGPTGGLRGAPVLEPSWAGNPEAVRRARASMANNPAADGNDVDLEALAGKKLVMPESFEPMDSGEYLPPQPSRAPWILLGITVALLGGATAAYFLMFRKPATVVAEVFDAGLADATVAAVVPIVEVDAAVAARPTGLAAAWQAFYADTDLEAAEKAFEAARSADPAADAEALAGLSLTNAALAQQAANDALDLAASDARAAEQATAEARRRGERASKFAKDAAARQKSPLTGIAAAEARRVAKAPIAEVDKLVAAAGDHPEGPYVKAMARLSNGKLDDAAKLLSVAAADYQRRHGAEHLRARLALARIYRAQKRWDDARRELGALLAAAPEHARGKALADKIAAESGAVAAGTEPAPADTPPPRDDKPPPSNDLPAGEVSYEAYDGLVARGNQKAENGDCIAAMKFFEKALDARPAGVEALVGLGYCHLDRREFPRALASFRAALAVSPRYGDAIIGMAEAHRYQGQSEQAAEMYQRYLDTVPSGPKAAMARKQLENLAPKAPEPPPEQAPAPSEDPAPQPQPEPAPAEGAAPTTP